MNLDVAIATWQPSGILSVERMQLPVITGVRYVVSWQLPGPHPVIPRSLASRPDVTVCYFYRQGVSANRNNALRHCTAPIVLMADDDLDFYPDGLRRVMSAFDENPGLDLATFRHDGADGKKYPPSACSLQSKLPKNYSVATFEIAVRRSSLASLEFDELYGPGAPVWQAAEDEKFLLDARRRGLHCRFFPITIARHQSLTTGFRPIAGRGVAAASGRIIRLEYPLTWPLRLPLKIYRQWRRGASPLFLLRHMLRGIFSSGKA